ncbi:sodium-dependent transporter [Bacteroides helcogenes]|uniref:Transporter n=1 Tax=Bacteroides helcogenes (strain ATCC 35417 / DSM 20613 / JCM 6297 / CCUG 15421 / P 36-108) TaxID=693979 RepID=E6SUW4_BACT6|nr:sodium-dependent transporter [Bacteroides helcogenes]ADV42400.1 sodium:neurotransmitter symporter [Bacteroides helcogenes P 36-108]MDY5237144.1 sodium-dependent transporter [Bacteroides helcogenes]
MTRNDRANFGSKIGVILASAGSAVGLGNIWRFPFETGNHGGAAFILIYLACVLILGIPIMIAEFLIGRHSRANTAGAYQKLAPGTLWRWIGRMGVLTGFLILGYYSVVAGWTLEFIGEAAANGFAGKSAADFISSFNSFVGNPWRPVLWMVLFLLATHFIIVKGVEKGIEKSAKIMMPMLFILLIILAVCSVSLPGAGAGIEFLLKPDFSKVDGNVLLGAMGQAFFSLSLGMGCLCTYASYFRSDTNLSKTSFNVAAIDTLVAVLAGFIIFPAAFSVGIQPDAGPSLLFITLPNVFQQAFGGVPWLAVLLSVMFYVLLALAALTSTISLHEVATAYLHEEFDFTRGKAAKLVTAGCIFLGALSSLSLGAGKEYTIFGMTLFDLFDFVTAKIMLPTGGFFIAIFTGWYLDKKIVWEEISNDGTLKVHIYRLLLFILKFIAPIGIAIIFINELGLLR